MGAPIGRPKINREDFTNRLNEWSRLDTSLNFCAFCDENDIHDDTFFEMVKDTKEFSDAYKKAKMRIANRRERMANNNELNYGIYQRQLTVYDKITHRHEREEKEFEANLKRMMNDDELRSQLDQFLQKFNPK